MSQNLIKYANNQRYNFYKLYRQVTPINSFTKSTIPFFYLFLAFIISVFGVYFIEKTKVSTKNDYYDLQYKASHIMQNSISVLKDYRIENNIPINIDDDPNRTGLIGEDMTLLVTSVGNLQAKRTSTNPDFAALMVKFFKELDLKAGDYIAIGASGSFPALLIATLSAAKVMELKPLIIYSIGASNYGATIPGFTFIDMLRELNRKNIFDYKLLAVSLGGDGDLAQYMFFEESEAVFDQIAQSAAVTIIKEESLEKSIAKRMELYAGALGPNPMKVFINIGGASTNFGATEASLIFPNGLSKSPPRVLSSPVKGLIFEYSQSGIPVIHLLNIKDLAMKNKIPVDPIPIPQLGTSGVFFHFKYRMDYLAIFSGLTIFILITGYREKKLKKRSGEKL
ncbi:MAG TPA: poly-gamma-glutamate system protein [Petrotogaceae bacterium]|nr:poly-gamma-glutamate system protein [Petrotogaceae bacterium]